MEKEDSEKKDQEPRFCLKFKLKVEPWQADIIDKRMEAGRKIQNALIAVSLKRWNELKKTKKYRALIASLSHDKKHPEHDKPIWKEINKLRADAGLTRFGIIKMVTPIRQHFKEHIPSHMAQQIAKNVWDAYEDLFYSDGKEIHFKKYGQRNSLEGNDNISNVRFMQELGVCRMSKWSNSKRRNRTRKTSNTFLDLPVVLDEKNEFETECMSHPIAFCRILREYIRGKRRYFIQIVFKGEKPQKRKNNGNFKYRLGHGDVGIDIGTATVAYASSSEVYIGELAKKAQGIERGRWLLQRKLDRSKRAMNPQNYNENGTTKKDSHHWVRSKSYMRTLFRIKELYRRQRVLRKQEHEELANHIMTLGNRFYVEDMNFKALQKRAEFDKENEKDKRGKFKRKKRFGKSLASRAPAMFLMILNNKLRWQGAELTKIDTWNARASQFNHLEQEYKKKKLSDRWNHIQGYDIQRDMYSAFLIMNVNQDLKSFNQEKCDDRFQDFMMMHDARVKMLKDNKNLSSIAI